MSVKSLRTQRASSVYTVPHYLPATLASLKHNNRRRAAHLYAEKPPSYSHQTDAIALLPYTQCDYVSLIFKLNIGVLKSSTVPFNYDKLHNLRHLPSLLKQKSSFGINA